MKLLMISTDKKMFEPGSAVALRQIAYAKGYEEMHIVVFTPRTDARGRAFMETSIGGNVWVYPTRSRSRWLYPFDAIRLGRFICVKRGITEITTEDSSLTAMAGVSLKKQFGIPLEINLHADIGSPYFAFNMMNKTRKFLSLQYLPKADKIRVVSGRIRAYLTGTLGIAAEKITLRPIAVDTARIAASPLDPAFDLRARYPQFDTIALTVSRLEPEKDIALALRAWKRVVEARPKAGLVVVGEGREKPRLVALARTLGIGSNVIWLPWTENAALISYYRSADLYLNTSFFEGYGLALVEAHAAGLPIVSTDVGVAPELGAAIAEHDETDVARKILAR